MKQTFLSLVLIFFSIIWWCIGAFWYQQYILTYKEVKIPNTSLIEEKDDTLTNTWENIRTLEESISRTVKNTQDSVVSIVINKDLVIYRSDPWGFFQTPSSTISRQVWWGSWFFIEKTGTILTNKHVVKDNTAQYTVILSTWEEYDASVVALDPVNDLAIIKINAPWKEFPVLPITQDIESIDVWMFSIAVWNALAEFQNSVSLWIISGKWRTIEAWWDTLSGLLQTDAAINPWNSWWPLLSLTWEVIGINTAIASNSNGIGFAFALSQSRIDYMLESIKDNWVIKRPFIGINYISNSPWVARELGLSSSSGVYIIDESESIVPWSSAEKAGLEPWDIITAIDGIQIRWNDLWIIIQNSLPWEILELEVIKKSWNKETLSLTLWEY